MDENEKELKQAAEQELDRELQEYEQNKQPLPDSDDSLRATSLNLKDSEYDNLIQAIEERNRLSDFISDIICKGYRERVKK